MGIDIKAIRAKLERMKNNEKSDTDDTNDLSDVITFNYSLMETYISRACGYKTIFKNVSIAFTMIACPRSGAIIFPPKRLIMSGNTKGASLKLICPVPAIFSS